MSEPSPCREMVTKRKGIFTFQWIGMQPSLSTQGCSVQWAMRFRYVAIVTHLCYGADALRGLKSEQQIGGGGR